VAGAFSINMEFDQQYAIAPIALMDSLLHYNGEVNALEIRSIPGTRIDDLAENRTYVFSKDGEAGPTCLKLYNKLRAIQYGDEPDTFGFVTVIE